MNLKVANLYHSLPSLSTGERFQELWRRAQLRVELIQSSATPARNLYDQEQDEWVLLLEGRALLEVNGEHLALGPGDHLVIPAHTPHRVLETHPEPRCLWLAVHLHPQPLPDPEPER